MDVLSVALAFTVIVTQLEPCGHGVMASHGAPIFSGATSRLQSESPSAHGFGTTLIERTLESNGGAASIHYEAGGIVCEMRLPLWWWPDCSRP